MDKDIHIVTNLTDKKLSPWYIVDRDTTQFNFPEYNFDKSNIMRFR